MTQRGLFLLSKCGAKDMHSIWVKEWYMWCCMSHDSFIASSLGHNTSFTLHFWKPACIECATHVSLSQNENNVTLNSAADFCRTKNSSTLVVEELTHFSAELSRCSCLGSPLRVSKKITRKTAKNIATGYNCCNYFWCWHIDLLTREVFPIVSAQ